jgi:lipopolysaccharide/colanic/teichoic acid biosynthesis glycosyltransferase
MHPIFSLLAIILTSPILFISAILIYLDDGGPIFFFQERVGKDGLHFIIYKLRTLRENNVTRIGRFLRNLKIDEIPQLFNIYKGDMNLIGPRPWIDKDYDDVSSESREKRLTILPGITGLAQVEMYRKYDKPVFIAYDLFYVDNCHSLWLNCSILYKTVFLVLREIIAAIEMSDEMRNE